MATYFDGLTPLQKQYATALTDEMVKRGITNNFAKAAILSIISKETEFKPRAEDLNYSAARIVEVWPSIPLAVAKTLEHNPEKLGNYVYDPKFNKFLGNLPGEGYKFRGRGPNQLTGRGNYAAENKRLELIYKQRGLKPVDLIANPELVNDPQVSAIVGVDYFIREFETAKKLGYLTQFNTTDINGFKNQIDSVNAVFQANAGWKKKGADTTGGKLKAQSRVDSFLTFVGQHKVAAAAGGGGFFFSGSPSDTSTGTEEKTS